jgi:leucyl aminopeptidase
LFLRRFAERTKAWAHFDIRAWTPEAKPGPEGAEALAARLLYDLIEARFGARGERTPTKLDKSLRHVKEASA